MLNVNVDLKQWSLVSLPTALTVYGEAWHGLSWFDTAAEEELRRLVPNPHPVDVRMAIGYTSSYARRGERLAGNPLPERGYIPPAYMSIFRYTLVKLYRMRQLRDMLAAVRSPLVSAN